jgi:hypothetical protein
MSLKREESVGRLRFAFATILLLAGTLHASAQDSPPSSFKRYETPYYIIYSDLEPDRVKEAALRMTRMAEEYQHRTADFSGRIRDQFQFWLFKDAADYFSSGGPAGSAGVYMSHKRLLMGIAGENQRDFTWHIVQHEGFHQFADAVIRGDLPAWLNEGLADYFGEGLFTGDGFVTGVVPLRRLAAVQDSIKNSRFKPIRSMMLLSRKNWNAALGAGMGGAGANYDQAWSMVHFLAHAENGKYQKALTQFVLEIGRGRPWDKAWLSSFGPADGFEKQWKDWWLNQPPHQTADLYAKACAMTYASYIGRAKSQKQTFDNFEEFISVAKEGNVNVPDNDDWLPPTLLQSALRMRTEAAKEAAFTFGKDPRGPQVIATMKDGTRILATFDPKARPSRTKVETDDLTPAIAQAESLLADQKKQEARKLLTEAIKRNPKSPDADKARKLLQGIK